MKQRSQEWLDARAGKLTASRFAAALGMDPYCSRQKLWRQLTGRESREAMNPAMQWGVDNEANAINAYEVETGNLVIEAGFYLHTEHDWLGASPDGLVDDDGLIECKCPQQLHREVPAHYRIQMMGQMAIMGRAWCDFVSWTPGEANITRVPFEEAEWAGILKGLQEFWTNHVLADVEPPRKSRKGK